eukprot:TRINITY_DN15542_c0_g1_i2.p1 TRINITY_DN15542_c0_g1~~TRINITY_DN15542_c0_g1_i2.p1  ORF type:complete len:540 (-),score=72.86 TRINITY_DN15542_c0_g1_i2:149-1768(-)
MAIAATALCCTDIQKSSSSQAPKPSTTSFHCTLYLMRRIKRDGSSGARQEFEEVKGTIMEVMRKIGMILTNEGAERALQELLRETLVHPTFDKSMVRLLRYMVGDFIVRNARLAINGIPIQNIVQSESKDFNDFVLRSVIKDKEYASGCVHVVIPLVLRVSLIYILLNINNASELTPTKIEYPAANSLIAALPDSLNFHSDCIALAYDGLHYNLLYSRDYLDRNPILQSYDRIYDSLVNEHLRECVLCGKAIKYEDELSNHSILCKPMHNYCLNARIEEGTGGKVLYTKDEATCEVRRQCPVCGKIFSNEDIKELFHKEAYEVLREQKKERKCAVQDIATQRSSSVSERKKWKCDYCAKKISIRNNSPVHRCQNTCMHLSCMAEWWRKRCASDNKTLILSETKFTGSDLICPYCGDIAGKKETPSKTIEKCINTQNAKPIHHNRPLGYENKTTVFDSNQHTIVRKADSVASQVDRRALELHARNERVPARNGRGSGTWKANARNTFHYEIKEKTSDVQSKIVVVGAVVLFVITIWYLFL